MKREASIARKKRSKYTISSSLGTLNSFHAKKHHNLTVKNIFRIFLNPEHTIFLFLHGIKIEFDQKKIFQGIANNRDKDTDQKIPPEQQHRGLWIPRKKCFLSPLQNSPPPYANMHAKPVRHKFVPYVARRCFSRAKVRHGF